MEKETIVYEARCRRLFDEDAYIRTFAAKITALRRDEKGCRIALDQTAFFPEGGGQAADTGMLRCGESELGVIDTREKEGQIWHTVTAEAAVWDSLKEGMEVQGEIDWPERFARMQNHSGEHIVSGLIHSKYGYDNVGFHMGKDLMTIDLNGMLTMEDLVGIEQEANAVIWQDLHTEIAQYPWTACEGLTYRSKKKLLGLIRIVTFPGVDACACCGTHVASTGQIGLIKIISCVPFRGGVRVEMLCGRDALAYMNRIWQQNHDISTTLSAKPFETADAVKALKDKAQKTEYTLRGLQEARIEEQAKGCAGQGNTILFAEGLNAELVRKLGVAVMEVCGGIALVFSGDDEEGYKYTVGQKDGDVRSLVKSLNETLHGRGGGKPFFAQGSVHANKQQIEEWRNDQHEFQ